MFDGTSGDGVSDVGGGDERARVHDELVRWAARCAAEEACFVRLVRKAEELRLWRDHGCISLVEYLERALGIEPRTALDKLRVAHRLEELPVLEALLEAGDISYSCVRELARIATAETEDEWLAEVRGKTVREVQQRVAGRARGDRPSDPIRPEELRCRVSFEVSPATKAWLAHRRRELAAERGHDFDDDDAFVRALAAANEGGTSKPTQVFLCEHEHRGWEITHGERAPLSPAALATELCDAEVVAGARTIRTISRRRRTKLFARHGNACAVPGCRSKYHLDLHHIVHQEHGGTHADWNLVPLCWGHHQLHHEGRLLISGRAPDQITFVWPSEHSDTPSYARAPSSEGPSCSQDPSGDSPCSQDPSGDGPRSQDDDPLCSREHSDDGPPCSREHSDMRSYARDPSGDGPACLQDPSGHGPPYSREHSDDGPRSQDPSDDGPPCSREHSGDRPMERAAVPHGDEACRSIEGTTNNSGESNTSARSIADREMRVIEQHWRNRATSVQPAATAEPTAAPAVRELVPEPIIERTPEESFALVAAAIAMLDAS